MLMSDLFSKSIIKKEISRYEGMDISDKISIISEIYSDFKNWRTKEETRYEQTFNDLFFGKLLWYADKINRHPQPQILGGKKADVALGIFPDSGYIYEWVQCIVELKWSDSDLGKKQVTYWWLSPVDQWFNYKTSFTNCPWLIVSNFASIRLYKDNKQDFQVRTLEQLVDKSDNYANLKSLLAILSHNNLIDKWNWSYTAKLLSDFRITQEEITSKFYKEYKWLRLDLINDIRTHNPEISVDTIIQKAQKLIDRVVFVHFCEDKGLLPDNKLKEVIIYGEKALSTTFQTLTNFFEAVNSGSPKLDIPNGYNGWLFHKDPELDNLKISDNICRKFVDLGKYDFDNELSVNILGHIFEQSISDLENLKINMLWTELDDDQLVESKTSKRKKDGIFYTPEYIVDYIVQNSLMKRLEDKESECLLEFKKDELKAYAKYQYILQNVKVLDPACGSGAFLVKVFDYLYTENKRIGQILGGLFDEDNIYKSILQNNIYWVDLNAESVEITKLSLWLKSAIKGKKLNNLDNNIKKGNSLISDPAVAGDDAFDRNVEFADIIKSGGFDVIVGNPPYVSSYWRQAQKFTKKEMEYFIKKYDTFSSINTRKNISFNTIMWFMERVIKLLKKNWLNWFIMDQAILWVDVYSHSRKYILENSVIMEIDSDILFPGVVAETCILFIQKSINDSYNILFKSKKLDSDAETKYIKNIVKEWYKISISENDWLLNKIENNTSQLWDICETFTWMQIIPAYFLSNDDQILNKPKRHKAIFSKNISRYWIQRPLDSQPGKYITYDNELQDNIRKMLTKKLENWENCRDPQSLSIWSPEKEYRFFSPKIVISQTVSNAWWFVRLQWSLDDIEQYYWNVSIHLVKHKDKSFLKFLICAINSTLITYYAKEKKFIMWAEEWSKKTPQIRKWDVDKLPIKNVSLASQQPFVELADRMLDLNKQLQLKSDNFLSIIKANYHIDKPSQKLIKFYNLEFADLVKELKLKTRLVLAEQEDLIKYFADTKSYILDLRSQIQSTDDTIDNMVYELYELTPEEIAIVKGR